MQVRQVDGAGSSLALVDCEAQRADAEQRVALVTAALEAFDAYYRQAVAEYEDKTKNGERYYLKKGERIVYMGQDITARKNGYVTLYGADHSHIDYLDKLAAELGLRQ